MPDLMKRRIDEETLSTDNTSASAMTEATAATAATTITTTVPTAAITTATNIDIDTSLQTATTTANATTTTTDRPQGTALGPEWLKKSNFINDLSNNIKNQKGNLLISYNQDIIATRIGLYGSWVNIPGIKSKSKNEFTTIVTDIASKLDIIQEGGYLIY